MRHPSGISLHLDVIALPPSDVSIVADDNAPAKDQRVSSIHGGALPKTAILLVFITPTAKGRCQFVRPTSQPKVDVRRP